MTALSTVNASQTATHPAQTDVVNETTDCASLPSCAELQAQYPLSPLLKHQIQQQRQTIHRILNGDDPRLLVVIGPCSIHDMASSLAYARRLTALTSQVSDVMYPVMRVYIEKPRTALGWKGFVTNPRLSGQDNLALGLTLSRRLMSEVAQLGLPIATEALNPLVADYFKDLVSWYAIGARTTESQTHREMASDLPGTIGFKNGTDGGFEVAMNAMRAAAQPHTILGQSADGRLQQKVTRGNANTHLVLRGGHKGPNYDANSIQAATDRLSHAGLPVQLMVDCSHANCGKVAERQSEVLQAVLQQRINGAPVLGVMLESFIEAGRQPLQDPSLLTFGQSVTDPCLSWSETEQALISAAKKLRASINCESSCCYG
ncbi:3-deoxy-7-phosphoheptulonate synthase [Terasakiispira papahanaumokuakeensis]|uniref:3-deoxy-7-phosphoheptulonate synthase n=1 Tax=Terasakiispira papahanaumokuakeensis TaxID=197479 RepID=UPI000A4351F0|nr:3-deoxy-7-phosphoheptulonate synthase [Terasakiispira papahanaumokuakeensis]